MAFPQKQNKRKELMIEQEKHIYSVQFIEFTHIKILEVNKKSKLRDNISIGGVNTL